MDLEYYLWGPHTIRVILKTMQILNLLLDSFSSEQ